MKKKISILCIITIVVCLSVVFIACDPEDGKIKPEISFPSEWPENEFTANIPKLESGEIAYTTNYIGANRFYISVEKITIEESLAYVDKVKEAGFVLEKDNSDENFFSYSLINEEKNIYISFSIPTLQNSQDGKGRNQMGITINTNWE